MSDVTNWLTASAEAKRKLDKAEAAPNPVAAAMAAVDDAVELEAARQREEDLYARKAIDQLANPDATKVVAQGFVEAPRPAASDVRTILRERGAVHGDFSEHARVTQALKRAARDSANWAKLSDVQKEAVEMILHKLGRVLAGDPDHRDHWDDTAGYATLTADRVQPK